MTGLVIIRGAGLSDRTETRGQTSVRSRAAAAHLKHAGRSFAIFGAEVFARVRGLLRFGSQNTGQQPRFNSVGGKSPRSLSRQVAQQPCSVGMILVGPASQHVFQSMVSFNAGELHLQFTTGASACPTNVFPKTEMDFPR